MKYGKIPDTNYVVRHIKNARLRRNGDGEIIGINANAFEVRSDLNELSLSVNWCEYFIGETHDQIRCTVFMFKRNYEPNRSAFFGRIRVGDIVNFWDQKNRRIRATHDPDGANLAHALLKNWPRNHQSDLVDVAEIEEFVSSTSIELFALRDIEQLQDNGCKSIDD